jgi:hypothetical protein
MSIERTTSANSTVTCLYSAGVVGVATGAPHSLQNFEFGGSSLPHDPHTNEAAVISRGHATVVPRHYRVTAGQPACAISRPQPTGSAQAAPRGVDKPHRKWRLAVNLTVQSWNVVAGAPKPVHVLTCGLDPAS